MLGLGGKSFCHPPRSNSHTCGCCTAWRLPWYRFFGFFAVRYCCLYFWRKERKGKGNKEIHRLLPNVPSTNGLPLTSASNQVFWKWIRYNKRKIQTFPGLHFAQQLNVSYRSLISVHYVESRKAAEMHSAQVILGSLCLNLSSLCLGSLCLNSAAAACMHGQYFPN